ncbi:acetyl-CoA C-acetyltransferase [Actinotalea sp. M2MS4P-6]|uniref:acetyl-CoA C-acetyltransferase n=1 Tax=Actinotalea sp. M2MS4P-6 TaxID=2983762 RepID=UPI0021E37063|nr:acetyl-CoA C-acetyltransferase [Actinotalea sp. M2MS4P-6]MCV2394742.1 acetyl-CoA C-acetyltransferase [Actinotalea sp. M2MS4P-6]
MTDLYIVSACRTAIGSFGGSLKDTPASELGAVVVAEALRRAGVAPDQVDEVFLGCVLAAGSGQNVARQAAVAAGIPVEVTATTVNMLCGSGMKTIVEGARAILAGDARVVVVGGTENMSAAPYLVPAARWGARMGEAAMRDSMLVDGLTDVFSGDHMGITAENVAEQWGIDRDRMDAFALESQTKAAAAVAAGQFAEEIVPVPVTVKRQTVEFAVDEYPRATTAEALAKLRPAFKKDGTVTAGSASGINDGAAALVLASGEAVEELGLTPMVRLVGWGQAGVDPSIMGVGPIEATRRALAKADLKVDDLDLIEANEAFAAQALAVGGDLGWDWSKVNVNGGAIALGHPIGASGARIVVTLLHEMARQGSQRGLATLCIGGGMGIATVYEAC